MFITTFLDAALYGIDEVSAEIAVSIRPEEFRP